MPEIRVVERVYDGKGNLVEEETAEISDEQLAVEAIEQETKQANDQALMAYQNYDNLSKAQKDMILKALLGDFISRNRERYIRSS